MISRVHPPGPNHHNMDLGSLISQSLARLDIVLDRDAEVLLFYSCQDQGRRILMSIQATFTHHDVNLWAMLVKQHLSSLRPYVLF